MARTFDVMTSVASSLLRAGTGFQVGRLGPRPVRTLELYEFENCPFCRKVREALSILDLEVDVRPCPKNGLRFREAVKKRGGKAQFPYLIDPNTGTEMYESDDIVEYLFDRYGDGSVPLALAVPLLRDVSSVLSGWPRAGAVAPTRSSARAATSMRLPARTKRAPSFARVSVLPAPEWPSKASTRVLPGSLGSRAT